MKILLPFLLLVSSVSFCGAQSVEAIAKAPFKYQDTVITISLAGGDLKQVGKTDWEYKIYAGGRRVVIEINDPSGGDFKKYRSALYCKIREISDYGLYLTALGNSKNTGMSGQITYLWKK